MAENAVKEKVQEIYMLITRAGQHHNWETIKEDLEKLFWLNPTESVEPCLTQAIWNIVDESASSQLTLSPRYNIMKLVKVKMTLNQYYAKKIDENSIKEICQAISVEMNHITFVHKCLNVLSTCATDTFAPTASRIYDIFLEVKRIFSSIYMHFEKHITKELNGSLSEKLDRIFYDNFIAEFSIRLNQDRETKYILSEFEKFQKSKSSFDESIPCLHSSLAFNERNYYIGEISEEGNREGYGKIEYLSKDIYEGFWHKDKRHGQGLYLYKNGGRYLGDFIDNLPTGHGCKVYSSGNMYTGEFLNGKKHGQGVMKFKNGDFFEGEWVNDDMHGIGKYTWTTGDYYIGSFVHDRQEGKGSLFLINGMILSGIWKAGNLLET